MRQDTHRAQAERLVRGYAGRVFLVLSVGWIGVMGGRQLLPPLLPAIIDSLAITPFLAGIALTLLSALYALAQYPGGRLADQLSRKTVLVAALATAAVGFASLSTAFTYGVLLVAVVILGIGGGAYFIAMRTTAADLYVVRRAEAFGIQMAFGRAGSALAAGVAVVILGIATWRAAFLPLAVVLAILAIGLHRLMTGAYVIEPVDLEIVETGKRVFGRSLTRRLLVSYALFVFTWQGAVGFLPTYLQIGKELSVTLASAGFAAVYVIGVVVGPLAGAVGDHRAKLPVAGGSLVLAALGLTVLVIGDALVSISLGVILFAIGLMSFPPVVQAYLMDSFADDSMGGDFGAFKTMYSSVGSLGPAYVGYVADQVSFAAAYLGLIACLAISFGLIAWINRTGPRP